MINWRQQLLSSFLISFFIGNSLLAINLLIEDPDHLGHLVLQIWGLCLLLGLVNLLNSIKLVPILKYALIIGSSSLVYLTCAAVYQWFSLSVLSICLTLGGFALWYLISWIGYWLYLRFVVHQINTSLHG